MATHVLAGDIGGTKTALALYAVGEGTAPTLVRERTFASREYGGLEQVIAAFLGESGERVAAAATNLPWRIARDRLSQALGGAAVRLMNDLESTAYGALFLGRDELLTLN